MRQVRRRLDRRDEVNGEGRDGGGGCGGNGGGGGGKKNGDGGGGNGGGGGGGGDPYGFGVHRRSIKTLRFKLPPAAAAAAGLSLRQKRTVTHVFHPVYPFAMSVSAAFMTPYSIKLYV